MRNIQRIIDDKDVHILTILQSSARTSNAEIARQVELAPSAVLERIRRLEEGGIIRTYEARLNPNALGLSLLAFVFVRTSDSLLSQRTEKKLAEIPEVQEVHHIAGEDCFLVKVRAATPEALGKLLREKIGAVETVTATRTTIVFETVKESGQLPIEVPAAEQSRA
jgi:Lrp/AsnC family leucine-responsive transcriptional regulator